jgi:hypothetical protein
MNPAPDFRSRAEPLVDCQYLPFAVWSYSEKKSSLARITIAAITFSGRWEEFDAAATETYRCIKKMVLISKLHCPFRIAKGLPKFWA